MADLAKQVLLCVQSAQNFDNIAPSFFKIISRKSPPADLRQIKQIVDAIKRTIKNKKQDSLQKYYALRLLHVCLAALNPEFAKYVIEKMLSRLITLACFQSSSKSENRGELLFGTHMNQEYSKQFLKILLTCFQLWFRYHPQISAFKTALTTLMKQGVEFPRCAKPTNLKDTERFLLKHIVSDDAAVFKISHTSQDYRQSIVRDMPPSMPSVDEILEQQEDTLFSQKKTFQEQTEDIIEKQSTVGAINMVKKYAKMSEEGDLEGMKGLIPSYRALKALKLQQENILEASLISGVQEAINHSLKMQEKIELILTETKPFYDNAAEIFAEEEKKQKEERKPSTQFEISDDLLNYETKLPSLPSQDSGPPDPQRRPQVRALLSEKTPDTPISFSFDEQFSHNIYPKTNSMSSVGFDLSLSGTTPVGNQGMRRISANPFNFELSAIMPEEIKEINESERPSQVDSVSSEDEKDTPRITRKPAPPPPQVPCEVPKSANNPFDFSTTFATYSGNQTEKILAPEAKGRDSAFDWDFNPKPVKPQDSGKTVNEWNFQFPALAARTDSNLTESERGSFKESPEKGVFQFEGALYHADSNGADTSKLNEDQADLDVPGEMSSNMIPWDVPDRQRFISLNQTEPTKSLKQKIRESVISGEAENTPDIFHPKKEKGPEAVQHSPPFRFDSYTQESEKQSAGGRMSNIATQGGGSGDTPLPVRMSLESRQGKYRSTETSSRKESREYESESRLQDEKLKRENEILVMRVRAMEKRIKEQEITIGDLESKLSTKKLKQEQELKIAEARLASYEKKMKMYENSIMEKEELIRSTRSQFIECEVRRAQDQGNYREESKRAKWLEDERKELKQKLQKSETDFVREHKLRQKYQSQIEEVKMQAEIEKRKIRGEINALKAKLKEGVNTSLSVTTLKLPPQRSLSQRKVSIFGDPSPRDRFSRVSHRRMSSMNQELQLPIDDENFTSRQKSNTMKKEGTRPPLHNSIELKIPDTERMWKKQDRKGSSLSQDQDLPSTDRLHSVNIHRASVQEVKNEKKPSAPFESSRPSQSLAKRKGSKEFNALLTEESEPAETPAAPFYQTAQQQEEDEYPRYDSMSSEFSLCSDIGAIGGIPLVNQFEAPGLEGLPMKSAMFYKQAVFLDRGVLFQDYKIQIGFIRQTLKSRGFVVQLFVGNKNGSYALQHFSMEPQKIEDGYVIENITDDPSSEVPPRKQERRLIQIKVDPLKGFVSGPLYEVKFVLNKEAHSIPVRVPILLVQLVERTPEIRNLSERLFLSTFESLSEKQKLPFTPDFSRLNSMSRIQGVFKQAQMFTIMRPRETLEFRKGGLFFACKYSEKKVLGRLKISPHLNQSEIEVASQELAVTVCVTTGLLEMLTLSGPGIPQF